MKRMFAGGALLVAALFTLQPATADTLPVSDTVITAPVVELPVAEPVIVTEPAPVVVEPEPVAEPVAEPEPAPIEAVPVPVVEAPVTLPDPVETATEPVVVTAPETVEPVATVVEETLDQRLENQCTEGTTDPAVVRWCEWKAAQ